MSSRLLKELKSLSPWQWDSKVIKHPPGAASLRDFEKVDAAFLADNKQLNTRLHENSKENALDFVSPNSNRGKSKHGGDNLKDPHGHSGAEKAGTQDHRQGKGAAPLTMNKKKRRRSSPERGANDPNCNDAPVEYESDHRTTSAMYSAVHDTGAAQPAVSECVSTCAPPARANGGNAHHRSLEATTGGADTNNGCVTQPLSSEHSGANAIPLDPIAKICYTPQSHAATWIHGGLGETSMSATKRSGTRTPDASACVVGDSSAATTFRYAQAPTPVRLNFSSSEFDAPQASDSLDPNKIRVIGGASKARLPREIQGAEYLEASSATVGSNAPMTHPIISTKKSTTAAKGDENMNMTTRTTTTMTTVTATTAGDENDTRTASRIGPMESGENDNDSTAMSLFGSTKGAATRQEGGQRSVFSVEEEVSERKSSISMGRAVSGSSSALTGGGKGALYAAKKERVMMGQEANITSRQSQAMTFRYRNTEHHSSVRSSGPESSVVSGLEAMSKVAVDVSSNNVGVINDHVGDASYNVKRKGPSSSKSAEALGRVGDVASDSAQVLERTLSVTTENSLPNEPAQALAAVAKVTELSAVVSNSSATATRTETAVAGLEKDVLRLSSATTTLTPSSTKRKSVASSSYAAATTNNTAASSVSVAAVAAVAASVAVATTTVATASSPPRNSRDTSALTDARSADSTTVISSNDSVVCDPSTAATTTTTTMTTAISGGSEGMMMGDASAASASAANFARSSAASRGSAGGGSPVRTFVHRMKAARVAPSPSVSSQPQHSQLLEGSSSHLGQETAPRPDAVSATPTHSTQSNGGADSSSAVSSATRVGTLKDSTPAAAAAAAAGVAPESETRSLAKKKNKKTNYDNDGIEEGVHNVAATMKTTLNVTGSAAVSSSGLGQPTEASSPPSSSPAVAAAPSENKETPLPIIAVDLARTPKKKIHALSGSAESAAEPTRQPGGGKNREFVSASAVLPPVSSSSTSSVVSPVGKSTSLSASASASAAPVAPSTPTMTTVPAKEGGHPLPSVPSAMLPSSDSSKGGSTCITAPTVDSAAGWNPFGSESGSGSGSLYCASKPLTPPPRTRLKHSTCPSPPPSSTTTVAVVGTTTTTTSPMLTATSPIPPPSSSQLLQSVSPALPPKLRALQALGDHRDVQEIPLHFHSDLKSTALSAVDPQTPMDPPPLPLPLPLKRVDPASALAAAITPHHLHHPQSAAENLAAITTPTTSSTIHEEEWGGQGQGQGREGHDTAMSQEDEEEDERALRDDIGDDGRRRRRRRMEMDVDNDDSESKGGLDPPQIETQIEKPGYNNNNNNSKNRNSNSSPNNGDDVDLVVVQPIPVVVQQARWKSTHRSSSTFPDHSGTTSGGLPIHRGNNQQRPPVDVSSSSSATFAHPGSVRFARESDIPHHHHHVANDENVLMMITETDPAAAFDNNATFAASSAVAAPGTLPAASYSKAVSLAPPPLITTATTVVVGAAHATTAGGEGRAHDSSILLLPTISPPPRRAATLGSGSGSGSGSGLANETKQRHKEFDPSLSLSLSSSSSSSTISTAAMSSANTQASSHTQTSSPAAADLDSFSNGDNNNNQHASSASASASASAATTTAAATKWFAERLQLQFQQQQQQQQAAAADSSSGSPIPSTAGTSSAFSASSFLPPVAALKMPPPPATMEELESEWNRALDPRIHRLCAELVRGVAIMSRLRARTPVSVAAAAE